MNFKENLKNLLKEKNITQAELSRKLNVDRSSITNYIKGNREPNLEQLEKIKNFLACSYDDLLK